VTTSAPNPDNHENDTSLEGIIARVVREQVGETVKPILQHLEAVGNGAQTLTVAQACAYVGGKLSDTTARELIRSGDWKAFRLNDSPNSTLFVIKSSIDDWMQKRLARTDQMGEGYPLESYLK